MTSDLRKPESAIEIVAEAIERGMFAAHELPFHEKYRYTAKIVLDAYPVAQEASATGERLWCLACGTVTRTGDCDCRFSGHKPNQVNYADQLQKDIVELTNELNQLRIASPPKAQLTDREADELRLMCDMLWERGGQLREERPSDCLRRILASERIQEEGVTPHQGQRV